MLKIQRSYLYAGIGVVAVLVVFAFVMFQRNSSPTPAVPGLMAEVFYSPTCGCCINYMGHARDSGIEIKATQTSDMDSVKERFNIPASMRSCHTMKIGNYFVEGHIPAAAIQKLMAEKPDIDGIAMAGMPSGSPGMPGVKQGQFEIYAIKNGQVQGLFVKI